MERRQAVHETHPRITAGSHQIGIDLVGHEQTDTLLPGLGGFAHRNPHIGVDELHVPDRLVRIFRQGQHTLVLLFKLARLLEQFRTRPQLPGSGNPHVHAHQATGDHQRIAHVGATVADVGVFEVVPGLRHVFTHGHQVRTHLGWMKFVGQAVEHGHTGIIRQFLHDPLAGAAVFDGIVHAAQHPGGILDRLLFADM